MARARPGAPSCGCTSPPAGSILFDGQDISTVDGKALRQLRKRMQMIFQDPYASLNPRMTAGGDRSASRWTSTTWARRHERRERVHELLATVGLNPDYGDRYPHEF